MEYVNNNLSYSLTNSVFKASCNYFRGGLELCSSSTSKTTKFVAILKIISLVTILLPVCFGVAYLVTKALKGRAKPIPLVSRSEVKTSEEGNKLGVPAQLTDLAQRTDHIGGGVLPYFREKNGDVYLMLSKEENVGPAPKQWCDFGGAKDRDETAIATAAREGWEESRDVLGTAEEIKTKIAGNVPIGMSVEKNKYAMFFLKVEASQKVTNADFKAKIFTKWCRMEKTDIAWVKAEEVFAALLRGEGNEAVSMQIDGKAERLRGCFVASLRDALKGAAPGQEWAHLEQRKIVQTES